MGIIGALIGLVLAIFLILKKVSPAYALILGAIVGGLLGGHGLADTIVIMIDGVRGIVPAILRILSAGVLSGVLIATGAAESIANALLKLLGKRMALAAIAVTTALLCAVGVFIDVAVLTIAPIALSIGTRTNTPYATILLTMIGGGKCGNIISPNPNTIIASENMHADLSLVMAAGIIPAIIGLIVTILIVTLWIPKTRINQIPNAEISLDNELSSRTLPSVWSSMVAPLTAIFLLALRPLFGISIDPLVALPVGGIVGLLAMRQAKHILPCLTKGLQSMTPIAILLIGTGTIAGVITHSGLNEWLLSAVDSMHLSPVFIAPFSGVLMSAATASTTAGATLASSSFAEAILESGVSAVWGAAMINAGATVLDHLPHGSFFHATGGACGLTVNDRIKLIPFESLIGLVLTVCSTAMAYFFG